jgi:protein ImuA
LHLAAQGSNTMFWMMRPLSAAQNSSPAPLRLALRPAAAGVAIEIVKRRGPQHDTAIHLQLDETPAAAPGIPSNSLPFNHASLDRRAPAAAAAGNISSALV